MPRSILSYCFYNSYFFYVSVCIIVYILSGFYWCQCQYKSLFYLYISVMYVSALYFSLFLICFIAEHTSLIVQIISCIIVCIVADIFSVRAWALWEQFQKKAQLYHSNVILVPHGDDFRYNDISEWDKQLGNMEKLMDYMNADRDMNIKVHTCCFFLE